MVHVHCTSSHFVIINKKKKYCFVSKSTNFLRAKNGEKLTSGHLELAPTLKVQQSSKHPAAYNQITVFGCYLFAT